MPSFCRHNRLLQNCPICTKEQNISMRPAISRFGETEQRSAGSRAQRASRPARAGGGRGRSGAAGGMTVRRVVRDQDDGFQSALVPGLRSSAQARRLADEVAFATARCTRSSRTPAAISNSAAGWRSRSPGCRRWPPTTRSPRSSLHAPRGIRTTPPRPTPSTPEQARAEPTIPPRGPGPPTPTAPGPRGRARRPPRSGASRAGRPSAGSIASTSGSRCPAWTAPSASTCW